jgi:hypothetical protein
VVQLCINRNCVDAAVVNIFIFSYVFYCGAAVRHKIYVLYVEKPKIHE